VSRLYDFRLFKPRRVSPRTPDDRHLGARLPNSPVLASARLSIRSNAERVAANSDNRHLGARLPNVRCSRLARARSKKER
jgi:hypothetical protein